MDVNTLQNIMQVIREITWPAVVALGIIIIMKPLMPAVISWFRSRTNNGCDPSLSDKIDNLSNNHMHEICDALKRIESKLDTIQEYVIKTDTKLNDIKK